MVELDKKTALDSEFLVIESGVIEKQWKIEQDILHEYANGSYSLFHPYVKISPYGVFLTALVMFDTNEEQAVSVALQGGDETIFHRFATFCTHHQIPILGLIPDAENEVTITCTSKDNIVSSYSFTIKTEPLPKDFPQIEVYECNPEKMEPGMIVASLNTNFKPYLCAIDRSGTVRWLYSGAFDVFEPAENGHFYVFSPVIRNGIRSRKSVYEIDLLGKVYAEYDVPNGGHHDICEAGEHLLILGNDASGAYVEDTLVALNKMTGALESVIDLKGVLDKEREGIVKQMVDLNDPMHVNAVVHDATDDSFLLSVRNQNTVVKIKRKTNELVWILGTHANWNDRFRPYLLQPVGSPFQWSFGQHAPMKLSNGNLLVYDNGNFRDVSVHGEAYTPAYQNFSRAVEYRIDEDKMTVEQVWEYGKERGAESFTPFIGDADLLAQTGNRLITFGGIATDIFGNPTDEIDMTKGRVRAKVVEVTGETPAQVIFEAGFSQPLGQSAVNRVYRSKKLRLYSGSFGDGLGTKGKQFTTFLAKGRTISPDLLQMKVKLQYELTHAEWTAGVLQIEGKLEDVPDIRVSLLLQQCECILGFAFASHRTEAIELAETGSLKEFECAIDTSQLAGIYRVGFFLESAHGNCHSWTNKAIDLSMQG